LHNLVKVSPTSKRHSRTAQAFHWVTVIIVLAAYAVSPGGREARVYSTANDFGRTLHESLGMLVIAVVMLRLIWRIIEGPRSAVPMPSWMTISSRVVHIALYVLLFAIPLTAILGAWYEAHPVTIFGLGDVGPRLGANHDRGAYIVNIHTTLGNAILWIAGFHAVAALYHHFVMHDDVLAAMVPGLSSRGR